MGINEDQLRFAHSPEIERLRDMVQEKEKILNNYKKEHGDLQIFFEDVKRSITPLGPSESVYKPDKSKKSTVFAVKQISDVHMGEVQESGEVEGFNTFSPDIADRRGLNFSQRFIDWIYLMRNAYNIPEVHILATGDMISGDIHQELQVTNAFPVTEQVVRAAQLFAKQIETVTPHFEKVVIHYITADNHSRLTKKPQSKQEGINSMNYLVAILAQSYCIRINVDFRIYPQFEKVINVNDRQYLIAHGHGIQGWMGIPWYSISRKVSKEAMARMEIIMNEQQRMKEIGFHKYIFGHWHVPFDHPHYSCSGSLSGTSAYDHKNGRHADPSQPAWLVHRTYGEFNRINFNLKNII